MHKSFEIFKQLNFFEISLIIAYIVVVPLLILGTVQLFTKSFKEKRTVKSVLLAVGGIIYASVGVFLANYTPNIILYILFRDFVLTISSFMLATAAFTFAKTGKLLRFITYISLIVLLLLELITVTILNLKVVEIFIHLKKVLILVALYPVLWALTELINRNRLKLYLRVFLTLFWFVVGVLWELNEIQFNISAFIGLALIIASSLVYIWFTTQGEELLNRFLQKVFDEDDAQEVANALNKLLFLGLLYIYYISANYLLNLQSVFLYLQNFSLINTELVNITLFNFIVALYIFFFLYYFVTILKKLVKLFVPKEKREDIGGFWEVIIYNIGILISIVVFLSALGLSWRVLIPVAGALGIGLGFGLQTILNNYISGFILMFSRIIKVGDFVEIPGNAGKFINNDDETIFGRVENISILTTQIRTLDGIDILVPNSSFVGNQVINYSLRNPYVRVTFPFGVAYSSDPKQVKEILLKLAYDCPWAKNFYRPPQVWFKEMGDSALIFELKFWVDIREVWRNPHATISHSLIDWVYTNGWYRLKEANIEIPFPQQDIWFRNKLKVVFEKEDGTVLGTKEAKQEPPKGA